jgi:hypothetical protein
MIEPVEPTRRRLGRNARRCLFGVILLFATGAVVLLLSSTPADEAFRWFGRLGFPDVKGKQFVRIVTGQWSQSAGEGPTNQYIDAFLLSESNGTFVVLTKDLFVRSFIKTPAETAAHQQVGYEPFNLALEAEAYLRVLKNPPKDNWRRFGQRLHERAEVFVLAWACDRNGQSGLAKELFDQASFMCESVPARTNWWGNIRERIDKALHRSPKKLPLIDQLERDIAHSLMWRAIEAFGDPSVSRRELLNQLQTIVRCYPSSEHVPRAKATSEILERMIKEDEAHTIQWTSLDVLPMEQRVAELIFRLRDQNGHQFSQPGSCDIFEDYRGTTNTPAHEFVRIGYPAVPQLIAAIDDPTLTRSVGYHRNFYFSHTILTVGDCAIAILQRITGKSFYLPRTTSSYPSKDGGASPARKAAERWWAEFQAKGERQTLVDAVSSGSDDAPAQGELLIERYPMDTLAAIVNGARASAREWTRTRLVELAARLTAPEVTNFLRAEMQSAPALQTRVAAAHALRSRGDRSSVAAMLHEWQQWNDSTNEDDDPEKLVAFLAGADSTEAITALGRDLNKRKVQTRLKVVESLGRGSWPFEERDEKMSVPTLAAIEAELVKSLNDKEERTGMSGSWGDKSFSDPRVCDFAGHFLAKRWPRRYAFDLSGLLKVRERQRIECQNVWRVAHGLEPLLLPAPPATTVRAEDCTRVTLIEWDEGSQTNANALFRDKLVRMKNHKLTASDFVELLTMFATAPAVNTSGIALQARKDDDLTGVTITIRLLPGRPPAPNLSLRVNQRVTVGHGSLLSSSGGGSFEHYASLKGWGDFVEAAAKALAAPPNTPFVLSAKLAADE